MNLNLRNVRDAIQKSLDWLKRQQVSDLIVMFGNTGSGKSTLLSALINGSDTLERATHKIEIDQVDSPQKKTISKWVI